MRSGGGVDPILEPGGADLLDATAAAAHEMVVVRGCARGVQDAARPVLDAMDPREDVERHEEVERAEHGRATDAVPRELAHEVLRTEGVLSPQRRRDHARARRGPAATFAEALKDSRCLFAGH